MKVAFGSVSAGGIGTPESEVTHSGGGPCAFVAIQSGGKAGGATPSKFSLNVNRSQQPGHGSGVGVGPTTANILTSSLLAAAASDAVVAAREADPA